MRVPTAALSAHIILAAAAGAGAAQVRAAAEFPPRPPAIHLEDRIGEAVVTGALAPATRRAPVAWRFAENAGVVTTADGLRMEWLPAQPWNPAVSPPTLERADGRLRVVLTERSQNLNGIPAAGIVMVPGRMRAEEWSTVVVRARGDGAISSIGLRYNLRPGQGTETSFPNPFEVNGEGVAIAAGDSVATYRLGLGGAPREIRELGLWFFANAAPAGIVEIESITLEPAHRFSAGHGTALVRGRPAVYAHLPARAAWSVRVPDAGRFDVGLGSFDPDSPTTFRTWLDSGMGPVLLHEETRSDDGYWAQRSIDLSPYAGRQVTLSLEAVGSPGSVAFWREPVLRSGDWTPAAPRAAALPADRCAALTKTPIADATIAAAEPLLDGAGGSGLPPHCRVRGEIKPTGESLVRFELVLPLESWNGRFSMVGNGGWAGTIPTWGLSEQLRLGNAAAASDTGHPAASGPAMARFAWESHERLLDFAHRAQRETTRVGKALTEAFYGSAPRYSYWIGGSTGGYQGLRAAQRDPYDFDGIVAGMPAHNWTRLMAGFMDAAAALRAALPAALDSVALDLLHSAVMAECDALDGLRDGLLGNPSACAFDPAGLLCLDDAPVDGCLLSAQVAAARRVYDGFRDPATGERLFPGAAYGTEPAWGFVYNPDAPFMIAASHFIWVVARDSAWDWRGFDPADSAGHSLYLDGERRLASIMNATDPDLSAFRRRGGKLLHWHGWSDPIITAHSSVEYHESVVRAMGDVTDFYRLFMVPGLEHQWPRADMQAILERWVERSVAPDRIVEPPPATTSDAEGRLLCSHPLVAVYTDGSPERSTSFRCAQPDVSSRRDGT
jgi:feruloyl esterase